MSCIASHRLLSNVRDPTRWENSHLLLSRNILRSKFSVNLIRNRIIITDFLLLHKIFKLLIKNGLIDWLILKYLITSEVIWFQEVKEWHILYVYIYSYVFLRSFFFKFFLVCLFFLHMVIWYQVFLSNTNNLLTVISYQVFLSNANNLYTVACSPVRWGCRIHRLNFCRGLRLPQQVSWIRH